MELIKKLTTDLENNLKPQMNTIFNGGPNSLTDQTLNTIDIELIELNNQIKRISLYKQNSLINFLYEFYEFNKRNYPPMITYSHKTNDISNYMLYTL